MGTWTRDEEVVLVYYITRNITYASIIEIMALRCHNGVRKMKHISDKVAKLRKHGLLVQKSQHIYLRNRDQLWDIKRADRWILSSMNKAELDVLLDFSEQVAAIISEQTNDLGRFLDIMHMDDEGKTYLPSRFNLYYEYQSLYHFNHLYQPYEPPKLFPMQSPHRLEHLYPFYQPMNTSGMEAGIQYVDEVGQTHGPSQFSQHLDYLYQPQFNQHYELPELSPMRPPHHHDDLGHLDDLDNLGNLDNFDNFDNLDQLDQ